MLKTIVFPLVTLVAVLLAGCSAQDQNELLDETCGKNYTETNGILRFNNHSSSIPTVNDTNCSWIVSGDEKTQQGNGVFLVVEEFALGKDDYVEIQPNQTGGKLTGTIAPVGILTGQTNVNVTLNTLKDTKNPGRHFQMTYVNTGCIYNITALSSGSFASPIYDKTLPKPVDCKFRVNPSSNDENSLLIHFPQFNIISGTVTLGIKDPISINATLPPIEEYVQESVDLAFKVPQVSDKIENFVLFYQLVSKDCSENIKLTNDRPSVNLKNASLPKYTSLDCHHVIRSDAGTTITLDINNLVLPEMTDQIIVLDGPNRTSPLLATITASNVEQSKNSYIVSSGNYLWIAVTSLSLKPTLVSDLTVSQNKAGGRLSKSGDIDASEETFTYLLEVNPDEQVELVFDAATKIPKDASVEFFSDFSKTGASFASLVPEQKTFAPIVSPGHMLRVEAKKFVSGNLKGKFQGIAEGCVTYSIGKSSGSYSVSGNCNKLCSWIIPPAANKSLDEIVLHFSNLQLSPTDNLTIRKQDSAKTLIAKVTAASKILPDIITSANDGVVVEIERGNCTINEIVIQASYNIQKACTGSIDLASGSPASILMSPNYPDHYPLGSNCTWSINRPVNSTGMILVTAEYLDFAINTHNVTLVGIKSATVVSIFGKGAELPNDLLVADNLAINFLSPIDKPDTLLVSAGGFKISFTYIDAGENITSTAGNLSFPGNLTTGSIFAWAVTILPAKDVAQNIISYQFVNATTTKLANLAPVLTIYDGPSVRSGTVNLKTINSTDLLSRTNSIIMIYRRETPSAVLLPMTWNLTTHDCNETMMCNNHICMHADWHCNDLNDCGDWSDEKYCNGTAPPAPPSPAPAPSTSGTSTTALTMGILASLIIGVLLGLGAPAALHRIRRNRASSYSTFSNSGE